MQKRLIYFLITFLILFTAGCTANNQAEYGAQGNQVSTLAGNTYNEQIHGRFVNRNEDVNENQNLYTNPTSYYAQNANNGNQIVNQNRNTEENQNSHAKNIQNANENQFRDSENADYLSTERNVENGTAKIQASDKNKNKVNKNVKRPKNVIVMIGDGMGIGQMEIARLFEYGKDGRLFMETLPNAAMVHTYSANNIVTDSAAAGTAIATGKKTGNGMIGVTPDEKETPSILDKFKEDGKKVGVISTNTATDATPAAFTASVADRWSGQAEVARQQLNNEIDVILGGGRSYFEPEKQNGTNLIEKFKEKGYAYASNKSELMNAKGEKLLGLFHPSYMNYIVDRDENESLEPTLPEMTQKAVEVLSKKEGNKGFFLMVEGARIDHAAHAADLTSIWKETVEFDHTVKYVTDWAKKNGNTLVVVLADHETMGISATEPVDINGLKQVGVSPEFMARKLEKAEGSEDYSVESVRNVFKKYANIDIADTEIQQFNENIKDNEGEIYPTHQIGWEIGSIIAAHHNAGVVSSPVREQSSTGGHTGNLVPIFTYGDGAEIFEGVLDNTDIPKMIAQLMGYDL